MPDHPELPEEVERRLASTMKSVAPEDFDLEPVPEGVWDAIEAEAFGPSARAHEEDETEAAGVTAFRARRRPRRLRWLAAAASVVLAAAVGAVAVARLDTDQGELLAAADLRNEGLSPEAAGMRGTARLEVQQDRRFLELRIDEPPPVDDSYLEVWLIDRAVEGMVSLGPYHGDGRYDIPAAVDPGHYPVVDISIEPLDGKPTHSGASAVRGVLA